MQHKYVKKCPLCGTQFSIDDICNSDLITPLGMQIDDDDDHASFYYFNHDCPECGTSFTVPVMAFASLIDELIPSEDLFGTDICGEHCVRLDDLRECQHDCKWAPFRRFIVRLADSRRKDACVKKSM